MSKNNNSIAKQALLDMESIKAAIKEESKSTLKALMAEAVKDSLREAATDEQDDEDAQEYEVQGDEQGANTPVEAAEDEQAAEEEPAEGEAQPEAPAEEPADAEGEQTETDEWSEFDNYKVGDDTYDLTGVEDPEQVVKVYKLLKNDDQVVVRKEGDKVSIKDPETDAEYVIDLAGDEQPEQVESEEQPMQPEEGAEELNEEAIDPLYEPQEDEEDNEEWLEDGESEDDIELEDDEDIDLGIKDEDEYWEKKFADRKANHENFDFPVQPEEKSGIAGLDENKKNSRKTMKEGKKQETIFEVDLGYTDSYQKEDPIAGLSSQEPSKQGRSVDKGIPTGTEKPWAGKKDAKKSQPFEVVAEGEDETPEMAEGEVDENITTTKSKKRRMVKVMAPNSGDADKPYVTKVTSVAGQQLAEIKAENKELKEAVLALKKSLNESLVTNVNLGKVTKLFIENTTSQAEKVEIINRFCNEAKTIEQSKALYESISRELKGKVNANVVKESVVAAKPVMTEAKTQKSSDLMNTIDLMNRVMKL